ncbi:MAG: hemerythrin domain-containing protein [Clostridiaceae bacterium]|nr:hemerythrin domain-containing protein [Clostridiaceae bacterium]
MRNFDNLKRQHLSIYEDIDYLASEIEKGSKELNVIETALRINTLAGKLKIHMLEEDKFLYPELLNHTDVEVKNMANQYISEMGHLAEEYANFKAKYNTPNKIHANPDAFISEAKAIIKALINRMNKEDNELYSFVQKKLLVSA